MNLKIIMLSERSYNLRGHTRFPLCKILGNAGKSAVIESRSVVVWRGTHREGGLTWRC